MVRPGVVFKSGECPPFPGLELAVEQDVADHPSLSSNRPQVEDPGARKLGSGTVEIRAPQELVAAANGQKCRSACQCLLDGLGVSGQVRRDQGLLAILPAPDVEQVVGGRIDRLPGPIPRISRSIPRHPARRASTAMFPRSA